MMLLKDFLNRVVPTAGGSYWGGSVNASGQYTEKSFDTIDELVGYIKSKTKVRNDCYFATGVYTTARKIQYVAGKKTLYVDIDCGLEKPYANQQDAIKALLLWCKEFFTPPSIIVNSGGGIHAYWTLARTVPLTVWQPLANQFKNHCIATGLLIDKPITGDAARIMRAPETTNYKDGSARAVKVMWSSPNDYELSRLQDLLNVMPPAALNPALAGMNGADDLSSGVGSKSTPRMAAKLIPLCNVFKDSIAAGGAGVPGLAWTHQLSVLAHCEDGAQYVHAISSEHDTYVPEHTTRKWERALGKVGSVGPPRCDTFAGYFPEKCSSCEYRGQISTPLQLGGDYRLPDQLPFPYQQDAKGVYYMATKQGDDGQEVQFRQEIVPFRINNFEVFESADAMWLRFSADYPDQQESALIDYSALMEKRTAMTELSRHHIPIGDKHYTGFRNLMSDWAMKMKAAKQAKPFVAHLGWVTSASKPGFAIADKTFWTDGTITGNTHKSKHLVGMYTPCGDTAAWKEVADLLLSQNRWAISTMVLTAFAAPLMRWTPASGAIMSFVSRESGSGKSTAMKVAQAVWGDPVSGINALDDTPASIIHKISYTNSMPAYWDEVRVRNQAAGFVKMIYAISQGKERGRLKSDISLQGVGVWNTLLTVASNESIADHAKHVVQDSESGRVRIFEVTVPVIPVTQADHGLFKKIAELRENYGQVGAMYGQFLANNHQMVKDFVNRLSDSLSRELKVSQNDRFWLSAVAALLAGAALATKAGLVTVDLPSLKAWLIEQFKLQRKDSREAYATIDERSEDLVAAWANQFRDQLVVCEVLTRRGVNNLGRIFIAPTRGSVLGVLAKTDKMLRVDYQHFTDWLYNDRGESPSQVVAQLKIAGARDLKCRLDAGLPNSIDSRVRCLEIPVMDDSLLDDGEHHQQEQQEDVPAEHD